MSVLPLQLAPLAPAPPRDDRRGAWTIAASILLHALAILLALAIARSPRPDREEGGPSYEVIFDDQGVGRHGEVLPPSQPADLVTPPDAPIGPPTPAALAPPVPDGAASSPPQTAFAPAPPSSDVPAPAEPALAPPSPAPAAEPSPQAAKAAPSAAPPAPAALAFAPVAPRAEIANPAPVEVVPDATPPAVRLQQPEEEQPQALAPIMPRPPPPLPPIAPRPRPAPRAAAAGTFANPMDLNFGPAGPRPAARGSVASRAIDLSPPAEGRGPSRADPYSEIRAAKASEDWNRGLLQFWLRHRYYPQRAVQNGEEGTVTIELTVNRSGRVEDVHVVSRSGSQWLDMAALGTFRGAQLPPFTHEMGEDRLTFPIPIHYYLIRR